MQNPEDRYVKVGKINTRYWALGQGSPLLLIHALGASCDYWRYNVRALSQGNRVYAFDLPGSGRSDKGMEDLSLPLAGEFVAAFLDALGVGGPAWRVTPWVVRSPSSSPSSTPIGWRNWSW